MVTHRSGWTKDPLRPAAACLLPKCTPARGTTPRRTGDLTAFLEADASSERCKSNPDFEQSAVRSHSTLSVRTNLHQGSSQNREHTLSSGVSVRLHPTRPAAYSLRAPGSWPYKFFFQHYAFLIGERTSTQSSPHPFRAGSRRVNGQVLRLVRTQPHENDGPTVSSPIFRVVTETPSDGRCLKRSAYVRGRPANNVHNRSVGIAAQFSMERTFALMAKRKGFANPY